MFNCLHSFGTEFKLKSHEKVYKNKTFHGIILLFPKNNILEFNKHMKSDKISCSIYADIECLIKKIEGCASNPEKPSTTKIQIFSDKYLGIWSHEK